MVQRYMSLPNLRKAQWSVAIFTMGIIAFVSVCCFAGLLVYDYHSGCDPLTAGLITVSYSTQQYLSNKQYKAVLFAFSTMINCCLSM